MKRTISLILSLVLLFSCLNCFVFADDVEVISGTAILRNESADSLSFGGVTFTPATEMEFSVSITVSGSENTHNTVYLNGERLGSLLNGTNIYTVNTSLLSENTNEISIRLGTASGVYNDSIVYGSVNLDDIVVESVAFSGVDFVAPEKMNKYMPIEGASGNSVIESNYAKSVSIGDGWFAETNLGGSTPNVPVSVGYLFNNPEADGVFYINTNELTDGEQEAVFYSGDSVVEKKKYIIDNTAPVIEFSAESGTVFSRMDRISFTVQDLTDVATSIIVDGKKVDEIKVDTLPSGSHTAFVSAVDEAGNRTAEMFLFKVTDKRYAVKFDGGNASVSAMGDATIMSGETLKNIYMLENPLGNIDTASFENENEVLVSFNNKAELVTSAIGNTVPYQAFVVNTENATDNTVLVSYNGKTGNGSGIVLKAWNYNASAWDVIATTESGEDVSVYVDVAKYSKDNSMKVIALPNIVYNGSDSILWNSDTQYYSRFEDLNDMYYKVNKYAVDLYNKNEIGYCVHTGDLIDQAHMGDEIAHAEFAVADRAQAILDRANVPNGVVSGNHDIMHDTANYSYYYQYFGEDRYKDFDWYGGSLNNNMHHYDLVSIGAYDFVFLYIGNFKEAEAETIAWANAVCKAYPTRNVVICTHEYILPSGAYSGDRAEVMWNEVIVPNENVVMVLCGHNTGVCDQLHQVGDSDRYVLEVLADYQFANLEVGGNDIHHIENNCDLDGEGFVRLMTFNEAGQVISSTYSPAANVYNYYPSYSDTFVYDIDLVAADRSITTTEFNVLTNCKSIGKVGESGMDLTTNEAFYIEFSNGDLSEAYVLKPYESNYDIPEKKVYETLEPERVAISGYENVSENFRMNQKNLFENPNVEVGFDLLKTPAGSLTRTSGSANYSVKIAKNNAITINHSAGAGGENWITLANYFNSNNKIDTGKYNRLYFGVTADKSIKWNIYVNFQGKELNFSQNKDISSLFGYVNEIPSDITGTWNGYIDLDKFVAGEQTIKSIYLVAATPDASVTFDYLFLGRSDEGKVRFITSDAVVSAVEAPVGEAIDLLDAPFKLGYTFDGWYTEKEGGEKLDGSVIVTAEIRNVYARFIENGAATENETSDDALSASDDSDNVSADSSSSDTSDNSAVDIAVLVCAVIFLAAGIVIFIFHKKSKA